MTASPDLLHAEKARQILQKNLSPRFRRLDRLERYVCGTQYQGRPSFWDIDYPMHDRAPCIVYPIVQSAIQSNTDLCIGEGRWPAITSFVENDDSDFGGDQGLSEDDSEKLDKAIEIVCKQSRLPAKAREFLSEAQGTGTVAIVCGVRNGKLFLDAIKAKFCTPKFDTSRPDIVKSLEVKYPYLQEYYDDQEKKWALKCMLYRRVLDEEADTIYLPVEADEGGQDVPKSSWRVDKDKTVEHGLGYCPVRWYAFKAEAKTVEDFDGCAVHKHLLDEVDCLNFGLSQRHAASMVASSPPTIEVGVDDDVNPSAPGVVAMTPIDAVNRDGDKVGVFASTRSLSGGSSARRRGPGIIWRYPSKDSRIEMLTLPGDALKPIDDHCRDLRAKLAEALSVVFQDIENAKSTVDVSGRALREQHRRQIERCDTIRDDFGANCLLPVLEMLMRLCLSVDADKLRIPGLDKFRPILERFVEDVQLENGEVIKEWCPPNLEIVWPDYFQPSEADQKQVVDGTIALLNAGLITKRTAVARIAEFYEIGNVDEYVDNLEQEAQEKAEQEMTQRVDEADQMGQVQAKTAKLMPPKANGAAKPPAIGAK